MWFLTQKDININISETESYILSSLLRCLKWFLFFPLTFLSLSFAFCCVTICVTKWLLSPKQHPSALLSPCQGPEQHGAGTNHGDTGGVSQLWIVIFTVHCYIYNRGCTATYSVFINIGEKSMMIQWDVSINVTILMHSNNKKIMTNILTVDGKKHRVYNVDVTIYCL